MLKKGNSNVVTDQNRSHSHSSILKFTNKNLQSHRKLPAFLRLDSLIVTKLKQPFTGVL